MQYLLQFVYLFTILYSAINAVVLKSSMTNNYPQIAILGCDSRKANLYYDIEKKVWVEHLISSCVHNEESILEFCQQAYPNLSIGNIVRLDTVLRFDNWCELISPNNINGDNIRRCKQSKGVEEVVQPFRCLYMNSQREEIHLPSNDCTMNSIIGTGECLRPEKWQQLASIECANKSMNMNSSIMTLDWCGLSSFRGIEFICCPIKKSIENDYETSLDENLIEDDPIDEGTTVATPVHRRIIAMTLASREPNWMEDYRRWNNDPAYFADDEDTNDYQPLPVPQTKEQQRFVKDKEDFKLKYKQQIDRLKSRWQTRQKEIQLLSIRNNSAADQQRQSIDIQFQQEYDQIKQLANQERTRLNELHETHLDLALNSAKIDANKNLISAWNEQPLKTEHIQKALYNYLQLFLNDRIHLVNRYERLRAVDPEQAERKRITIHERLRLIVNRINDAFNQLKFYPNFQTKIQPQINKLFSEYDEVNQAAIKLLKDYDITSTTTRQTRILPFGRDENKIYPFTIRSTTTNKVYDDTNIEYDYATNDEYDEDDENVNDEKDKISTTVSTTTTTTTAASDLDGINYDQIETGDSDWDVNTDDIDDDNDDDNDVSSFDVKFDDQNQQAFINENDFRPMKTVKQNPFVTYLPYASACLLFISILIGLIVFRCIKRHRSYQNLYEKNYQFSEVESCTPEEKALQALQMNGYENPTYKFFESQSPKC